MSSRDSYRQGLGFALKLGTEMTVATLIGASMGYAADYYLNSSPMGLIIGLLFGVAAGFKGIYQAILIMQKEEEEAESETDPDDEKPE